VASALSVGLESQLSKEDLDPNLVEMDIEYRNEHRPPQQSVDQEDKDDAAAVVGTSFVQDGYLNDEYPPSLTSLFSSPPPPQPSIFLSSHCSFIRKKSSFTALPPTKGPEPDNSVESLADKLFKILPLPFLKKKRSDAQPKIEDIELLCWICDNVFKTPDMKEHSKFCTHDVENSHNIRLMKLAKIICDRRSEALRQRKPTPTFSVPFSFPIIPGSPSVTLVLCRRSKIPSGTLMTRSRRSRKLPSWPPP